jgi:predicted ATPase
LFVTRAYVPESMRPVDIGQWPWNVPAVAYTVEHGLTFTQPIIFLVGDNGWGKSTLVEAIAEAFQLDARGGLAGPRRGSPDTAKTPLGEVLRLDLTARGARMLSGPRLKKTGG